MTGTPWIDFEGKSNNGSFFFFISSSLLKTADKNTTPA